MVLFLGIFNTMNMSIRERIPEIGTQMALGTKPGQIKKMIIMEGMFLGLVGGALGVLVGLLFTWILQDLNFSIISSGYSCIVNKILDNLSKLKTHYGDLSEIINRN